MLSNKKVPWSVSMQRPWVRGLDDGGRGKGVGFRGRGGGGGGGPGGGGGGGGGVKDLVRPWRE